MFILVSFHGMWQVVKHAVAENLRPAAAETVTNCTINGPDCVNQAR